MWPVVSDVPRSIECSGYRGVVSLRTVISLFTFLSIPNRLVATGTSITFKLGVGRGFEPHLSQGGISYLDSAMLYPTKLAP
jgi:hypothetical protein